MEAIDIGDTVADLCTCFEDRLGCPEVTILPNGQQCRPCGRKECPRAAPGQCGGVVEATGPLGRNVELMPAQVSTSIQDHGGSLCCIPVFVRVGGHRGDAWNTEIEVWYLIPKLHGPRKDETPETRVGMEADAAFTSHVSEWCNGVDDSMGKARCGPGNHDRAFRNGVRHGVDIGGVVLAHWDPDLLVAEVGGSLVECNVGGVRDDHLWL